MFQEQPSFFMQHYPLVTYFGMGASIEDMSKRALRAYEEGADGIKFTLGKLPPSLRKAEVLKPLIDCVPRPFLFSDYRSEDVYFPCDDCAREQGLVEAALAGAEMIDIMGDWYAPATRELTHDAVAIERQKELIARIHGAGAKVLLSSHLTEHLRTDEALSHIDALFEHGADMAKLVETVETEDSVCEAIRTTMALARHCVGKPFVHLCLGSYASLHRAVCGSLGTAICFCTLESEQYADSVQPSIGKMQDILASFTWRLP